MKKYKINMDMDEKELDKIKKEVEGNITEYETKNE